MNVSYHSTKTGQIETGSVRESFTRGMAKVTDRNHKDLARAARKAVNGKRLTNSEFKLLSQ